MLAGYDQGDEAGTSDAMSSLSYADVVSRQQQAAYYIEAIAMMTPGEHARSRRLSPQGPRTMPA